MVRGEKLYESLNVACIQIHKQYCVKGRRLGNILVQTLEVFVFIKQMKVQKFSFHLIVKHLRVYRSNLKVSSYNSSNSFMDE